VQLGGVTNKFVERLTFSTKLDQIDTAFDHLLRNAGKIEFFDIAEVNYSVEAAFVERPHGRGATL
jgi:hypothetical protein